MTREEYIDFANALKNNYTIDFDKLPEFCDMAVSAMSGGEYIKKEDVLSELNKWEWQELYLPIHFKENIIDMLPTYSIPDLSINEEWITWLVGRSVSYRILLSKIEKIRAEIAEIEDGISSYHNDRPWIFKDEALAVIDKYIGGKDK